MNIFKCVIVVFVILLLGACKKSSTALPTGNQDTSGVFSDDFPADFTAFYNRFHADTVYQMNHILFPLQGSPARMDSTTVIPPDFTWKKEGWVMHKPFSDPDGSFIQDFANFNGIINETTRSKVGDFSMVRRFSKIDTAWYLIYYKEIGR